MDDIIFINNLPTLDLHGYDRQSAKVATNDFINENIKLQNKAIIIIHGIGNHIVRNAVHETLKLNKKVKEYKLYPYNIGCTIVILGIDK